MMLEAFITNLGRYNEGYLDGAYLKLPAEKEDVQALLKKIHVDGIRYEEIFITDYETDVPGLYDCLGEYESMQEKDNYLKNAELGTEQNYNMIDGILNNEPTPVPEPGREPLDKVKEPPRKKRSRERDDR